MVYMFSSYLRVAQLLLLMTAIQCALQAQPYGLAPRAANTSLFIDNLPPTGSYTMQSQVVFPRLAFDQPLFVTEAPDNSNRLFVLEKPGRIKVFPKLSDPPPTSVTTFLDISTSVATASEQGLLGLAFDPAFTTNGRFYVTYSSNEISTSSTHLSRFTLVNPTSNIANPATEDVLLTQSQTTEIHKSGMLAFGPDGKLYVSIGDGGINGNGQVTGNLLGKILRLDVTTTPSAGQKYVIPADNPFTGIPGATRKEIWAYGLRNPWRFGFDTATGILYCGDVGYASWEELDIITKGANYGWPIREGNHCVGGGTCTSAGLTPPILEYDHSVGNAITGGYVYHGTAVPQLSGMYIFGDYGSRKVWALKYDGAAITTGPIQLVGDTGFELPSFGQDASGEVYLMSLFTGGGHLYLLRPAPPATGAAFPTKLSDLPALLQAGLGHDLTTSGVLPYAPSAKLWSDGANKERFIAMPGLQTATYTSSGGWSFPENTVILKNFVLPLDERVPAGPSRRVETRLLYRKNTTWNGFSYQWNAGGTDADLLSTGTTSSFNITTADGNTTNILWQFPSSAQCAQCHTPAAGGVLGLSTPAMNCSFSYLSTGTPDNQLRALEHSGFFSTLLPAAPALLPRMPDPFDTAATTESRARAYLHANCAQCHRPGGPAPVSMDLRWEATNYQMNVIDVPPQAGNLGVANARIVAPGDPDRSILVKRMSDRGITHQMPPLASNRVDAAGVALIRSWISASPALPVRVSKWVVH